jgi:hypothetical protein
MSDSLNATVIDIELVLTISAKGELEPVDVDPPELEEDDEPEPPRPPAVVVPVPPVVEPEEELALEVLEVDTLPVDPADTALPGERLASDTTVPLIGA